MSKYYCTTCNYNAKVKSSFLKHLQTKKHLESSENHPKVTHESPKNHPESPKSHLFSFLNNITLYSVENIIPFHFITP